MRPRSRIRSAAWLAAAVGAALLGSCGGGDELEDPLGPPTAVSLLALLPQLGEAGSDLLVDDAFDAADTATPAGWYRAPGDQPLWLRPLAEQRAGLSLVALGAAGATTVSVGRMAGELPTSEPDEAQLRQWSQLLGRARGPARDESGDGGAERLVARLAPIAPNRRDEHYVMLGVRAQAPPERVQVELAPAFEDAFAISVSSPYDTDAPRIDRINVAGEYRRALTVPCGSEVTVELRLADDARYIEYGVAALQGGDPTQFRKAALEVSITGTTPEITQVTRMDPPASIDEVLWRDERLVMDGLAGRDVAITFRAEGLPTHAVAIAHPRVVGARDADARPNVILVSLDTLRADRVGAAGSERGLTPRLDALAERGTTWTQASSTAPYTLPSHGSMFSGQLPTVHGGIETTTKLRVDGRFPAPHLARLFARRGWTTAAFTGGGYLSPDYGFAEGFDRYSVHDFLLEASMLQPDAPARLVPRHTRPENWAHLLRGRAAHRTRMETVLEWVEAKHDRPFFLFLHTFATHEFAPPEEYARAFLGETPEIDWGTGQRLKGKRSPTFWTKHEFTDAEIRHLELVYDATVRHTDEELGRLFDLLDELGIADETIVVVTSDHGEEFLEHGILGHSRTLYQQLLHVPLVAAGPGVPAGVVDEPVSLLSLAPTILGLAGLPIDARMKGEPLPLAGQAPASDAPSFHEIEVSFAIADAIRAGDWKVIRNEHRPGAPGEWELYDLSADPSELSDLSGEHADVLDRLSEVLRARRGELDAIAASLGTSEMELSDAMRDELEGLGYGGGDEDE